MAHCIPWRWHRSAETCGGSNLMSVFLLKQCISLVNKDILYFRNLVFFWSFVTFHANQLSGEITVAGSNLQQLMLLSLASVCHANAGCVCGQTTTATQLLPVCVSFSAQIVSLKPMWLKWRFIYLLNFIRMWRNFYPAVFSVVVSGKCTPQLGVDVVYLREDAALLQSVLASSATHWHWVVSLVGYRNRCRCWEIVSATYFFTAWRLK